MSEKQRIPIDTATPTGYNTPTPNGETIGTSVPNLEAPLIESMNVISPNSVLLSPGSTNCLDRKKRYVCTIYGCGKAYGKSSHLRSHMTWHSGEKPFICDQPFCGKGFTRSDELARHTRTHTGEKPYECNQCGKKFSRSDHLTKHMRIHYKYSKMDIVPMLEVSLAEEGATNAVAKELNSEIIQPKLEIVTNNDKDLSDSNRLGFAVFVKQELDEEAEAEFQHFDKDYECGPAVSEIKTEPERISTPPSFLTTTMPSGNIEFKIEPNQLNGSMPKRRKSSKTVAGDRPFHCWHTDCGKSFRRQDELNRHKRIHSGEKPFSCDHCDKRFLRSDHLKKHLKTHFKKFQVTDS